AAVGCTAHTIAPVSLFSATTRLPAAVVKTLPSPTLTPRCCVFGPKPFAVTDGCHFHLTAPVAPSSAMTPPAGVSKYMTPSTTIGIVCCAVSLVPGPDTGVVTGSAETWVIHAGASLLTFDLSTCVSAVYPHVPRLPATWGQSLVVGSQHVDCANVIVGMAVNAMASEAAAAEWANFIRISSSLFSILEVHSADRPTNKQPRTVWEANAEADGSSILVTCNRNFSNAECFDSALCWSCSAR